MPNRGRTIARRGEDKEVWDTAQPEEFRDQTADSLGEEPEGCPGRPLGQSWRHSYLLLLMAGLTDVFPLPS